jgi:hypothetical protein
MLFSFQPSSYTGSVNPNSTTLINPLTTSAQSTASSGQLHNNASTARKPPKVGMIVGILIGVIGVLLIVAATVWLICRRRNQRFMRSVVSKTDMIEQYPFDTAETSSTHGLLPPRKTTLEPNRVRQVDSTSSMRPPSEVVSSGVSNAAEPSQSPSRSTTPPPQASSSSQSRARPHVPLADSGSRPSTSSPAIPTERLTPAQVEIVQQLSEHNVPGPTLATLIDGMVRRERSTRRKARHEPNRATRPSQSGRDDEEDVPPAYDYRDAPR